MTNNVGAPEQHPVASSLRTRSYAAVKGVPRRLGGFARTQPVGAVALAFVLVLILIALFAPGLAPYDPLGQHRQYTQQPPSGQFWMGTDSLGRDVLSRVVAGARTSLLVAVATVAMGGAIGVVLGALSGYFGGRWVDTVLQRAMDALMAIPALVLLLFVAALLGPSVRNTIVALSFIVVPWVNRVARGEMLRIREEPYIEAARASGCGLIRILVRHGLPNLFAPLVVMLTLLLAVVMIAEASLSFLGIGTPPPTPSWGRMLSDASGQLVAAPWLVLFPGAALTLAVLSFNLLGDALRDFLDPRQLRR